MKNIILLFIILINVFIVNGQGLQKKTKNNLSEKEITSPTFKAKNIVKINPLSFAVKTINVAYERHLYENITAQASFFIVNNHSFKGIKTSGVGITLSSKAFYQNYKNYYLSPFVKYQKYDLEFKDFEGGLLDAKVTTIGFGFDYGGQWILAKNFSLEVFAGIFFNSVSRNGLQNIYDDDIDEYNEYNKYDYNNEYNDEYNDDEFDFFDSIGQPPYGKMGFRFGIMLGYAF